MVVETKRSSLVKPSINTPFHIDFDWWKKNEPFEETEEGQTIDWVDPMTAEVTPVDGIQNALMTHCVKQPDFLTDQTALVEAVFRLFLTNGNHPMSSGDLGARLKRPPETILRTLVGARVYKGIRPYSI